ncbi:hypothetical protein [Maribellus maritimus]|uniref:hypothetical protein n=1 Tax=Maribellus maritimus TaxID=2870838 RepID=UPI001EEA492F|nr:hypothetical protein [Maribellus maritimus]MCG6186649.1 hypothetical protein [Maribellus maritimus]
MLNWKKRNDMNIIKFAEDFPDENSCKEHFKGVRESPRFRVNLSRGSKVEINLSHTIKSCDSFGGMK